LRLLYEPMTLGEADGLDVFGPNARLAVVLYGLAHKMTGTHMTLAEYTTSREALARVCKRARSGKDGSKQEAAALVYSLVFQALQRARRAQESYSDAASQRGRIVRPWYVSSTARRAAW